MASLIKRWLLFSIILISCLGIVSAISWSGGTTGSSSGKSGAAPYLSNDSDTIYFSEFKLNLTIADYISNITAGTGNTSWNQSYASSLFVNITGDSMTGNLNTTGNVTASDFIIPTMTGNNGLYTLNNWFKDMTSAGRLTGGEIFDNGGGTIIIGAGTGLFRIADDDVSQVKSYSWDNSSAITIPADSIVYLGMDYNGGSITYINTTDGDAWFDLDTQFPLGTVINQGGVLHILNNPWWVGDGLTNVIERFQAEGWLERDDNVGGLILGYTGTRNPTLSAGTLWSRLTEHEIPEFDSTDGDDFNYYYRDGTGSWNVFVDQTQWNITHWDDGDGGLEPIGNNQYAVIWVWINTDPAEIALMYPQATYSNAASAEAEEIPNTFPAMWYKQGVIAGRIIIQEGKDIPVEIQTAFTTSFTSALAADHGNLAGLNDDDHTQYLLTSGLRDMAGNLSMGGYELTNVGKLVMTGLINSYSIVPVTDNLYTLGNSSNRYSDIYSVNVHADNVNSEFGNITTVNSTTVNSDTVNSDTVNSDFVDSATVNATETNTQNLSVGTSKVYISGNTTYYRGSS